METLDADRIVFLQIEAAQDIEYQQGGNADSAWRDFQKFYAAIGRRNRIDPEGLLRGEIVERVHAAEAAQVAHHVLGDPA
ncbi:hypothetical protein D9M72_495020 [compost metagenome]